MDFQFQVLVWLVVLVIAVLVGGPVLAILGMSLAWLLPWIILSGLVLLALAVIPAASTSATGAFGKPASVQTG